MKKLLALIAALGITATASTTVVACGTNQKEDHKLYDKLDFGTFGDKPIITLADGTSVKIKDLGNLNNLDDVLNGLVDKMVTTLYSEDNFKDQIIPTLKLQDLNLGNSVTNNKSNAYQNKIDELVNSSAKLDLFSVYVKSIASDSLAPLDQDFENVIVLNPSNYTNEDGKTEAAKRVDGESNYSVWFEKGDSIVRWTSSRELNFKDSIGNDYLPDTKTLSKGKFYLRKLDEDKLIGNLTEKDNLDQNLKISKTAIDDSFIKKDMNGLEALSYRFQDYLRNKIITQSNSEVMGMDYLKDGFYDIRKSPIEGKASALEKESKNGVYLDKNSAFVKELNPSFFANDNLNTENPLTTNYRMVWNFKVDKDKEDALNKTIAGLKLSNTIMEAKDFQPIDSSLKELFDALNNFESNSDKPSTFEEENKNVNKSESGIDPFWGETGYQGLIKDKKSVAGGQLTITNDSALEKISKANSFGVLRNGTKLTNGKWEDKFTFENEKENTVEAVIVLPIYILDILRSAENKQNNQDGQKAEKDKKSLYNLAKGQWIKLQPQFENTFTSSDEIKLNDDVKKFEEKNGVDENKINVINKNNQNYIYIGSEFKGTELEIKDTKYNLVWEDQKQDNSYTIDGIFNNPKNIASELNGQKVSYKIHAGSDSENPDLYMNSWEKSSLEKSNDIASLDKKDKEELMNTLFYAVSKESGSNASESAKNVMYRKYITLETINYKPLYDALEKYVKIDENEEDGN